MSDLALTRNCCLARMLPGEALFATRTNLPVSDFQMWQVWRQPVDEYRG